MPLRSAVPRAGALARTALAGVQRLLEVIQAELVHAAAYAGRATLKSIDKTAVKTHFV